MGRTAGVSKFLYTTFGSFPLTAATDVPLVGVPVTLSSGVVIPKAFVDIFLMMDPADATAALGEMAPQQRIEFAIALHQIVANPEDYNVNFLKAQLTTSSTFGASFR